MENTKATANDSIGELMTHTFFCHVLSLYLPALADRVDRLTIRAWVMESGVVIIDVRTGVVDGQAAFLPLPSVAVPKTGTVALG